MKRLIITLLATLHIVASTGNDNGFRFRHYDTDEGLPSSTVRAIAQDRYGFMWFGTDNGLCRYDGVEIVQYSLGDNINEQFVSCLYDDGKQLWVGTFRGIYLYDYTTGDVAKFSAKTSRGKSINGNVLSVTGDKEGNVWVATMNEGAFRYSKKSQRLDYYPLKAIKGKVSHIMIDSFNQVWAITNWAVPALWRLDKSKNIFTPITLKGIAPSDVRSLAITQDSGGDIWIGTWDKGLICINQNQQANQRKGRQPQHIHSITEYDNNHLLIGSDDGLSLYNTANNTWRTFIEDETDPFSLSNRFVYPIVKDREGGIWVGTFYGGINYIMPNANKFASFVSSRMRNSIGGRVINRFCEDHQGNIWIASDDGGLNKFNPRTNQFTNYTPSNSGLSYINVHALCADGKDLWIGTYTGGINRMDTEKNTFTHYQLVSPRNDGLTSTSCYSIFKDSHGRLWAASMESLFVYDSKKDGFKLVKDIGALTIDIDEDRQGNLWLSTQGKGLYRYTPRTGKWKSYHCDTDNRSLPTDQVNATLVDTDGNIIVATQDGLCKYDPHTDSFKPIELGLFNTNIQGIVEDNNNYWLATAAGLVKYQQGEPCQRFTKSDGLQSDQSLPNAMFMASNGRIYIGSQNGFNAFYPYEISMNRVQPNIHITRFDVINKPKNELGEALINFVMFISNDVELPHDANAISINFASLSYCAPNKNQYEYRLDGFDQGWINSDGRTQATYTNLPPGTYTFRVRGTNNDGVWCKEEATLRIEVAPPFYLSLPMKILYTLLAIVALFFGIRYMLHFSNRKHEQEISRIKAEKEKEVREAKIQFFTMIAHEIRTPVSLIMGPLENIMKSPASIPTKIRKDMDMIDRNAHRLLYLVNQLLDFRKVQTNSFVTHFKQHNIKQLIEAVGERFEPTFKQKGIAFSIDYPDDDFTAIIDSEAITKVISNLLTNANKYTRDKVSLKCLQGNDVFTIVVADNGMGVRQEDQQRIFQPFYQAADNKPGTGIGLSIVKSIVEQHHGDVSVKSVWGEGSTFTVTLPIRQPDVTLDTLADDGQISDDNASSTTVESTKQTSGNNRPTMLIVEDNDDMASFIAANFENEYNVLTAADGEQALQTLYKNEVTLVLSDWMMPNMDGVTLCRRVRNDANISHIPFILLTAKTDDDSKAQGMECGADIYLEKPFSMHVLKSSIANMINLRRLLRQKFSGQPLEPITHITSNPLDSELLSKMQKIIEENLANEDLNVNFLTEHLNISRSTLFAKIKMFADVTPNEMIQMIRLKAAAKMLTQDGAQVTDVCYKVGFSSPSYFSKCFQKQFGMKPIDMKNMKKTNIENA